MSSITSKLAAGAAIAAAAVGGAAIANAASSSTTPSATPSASQAPPGQPQGGMIGGRHAVNGVAEKPLTGDVAAKVKAAALAKVPGTIQRVETNVDGSAPYEAHITKSDGTQVEVQISRDYQVVATHEMG